MRGAVKEAFVLVLLVAFDHLSDSLHPQKHSPNQNRGLNRQSFENSLMILVVGVFPLAPPPSARKALLQPAAVTGMNNKHFLMTQALICLMKFARLVFKVQKQTKSSDHLLFSFPSYHHLADATLHLSRLKKLANSILLVISPKRRRRPRCGH